MAVNFGDPKSGFRHHEVVTFINEEVLSDGGGPSFYEAYLSQPWHHVEDQLRAIVVDPQVPRAVKRACTWSGLALGVRFLERQQKWQLNKVQRLLEQISERETTTWALSSQLQKLQEERQQMAAQLQQAQEILKKLMQERNFLCTQLFQAKRLAFLGPQSLVADVGLPAQEQLVKTWSQGAEKQVVMETEGAAAGAAAPPQMHPQRIYTPDLWAAEGSQEEMAREWAQRCHDKEEGSGTTTFINPTVHNWNHCQQTQKQKTKSSNGNLSDSEEAGASGM